MSISFFTLVTLTAFFISLDNTNLDFHLTATNRYTCSKMRFGIDNLTVIIVILSFVSGKEKRYYNIREGRSHRYGGDHAGWNPCHSVGNGDQHGFPEHGVGLFRTIMTSFFCKTTR